MTLCDVISRYVCLCLCLCLAAVGSSTCANRKQRTILNVESGKTTKFRIINGATLVYMTVRRYTQTVLYCTHVSLQAVPRQYAGSCRDIYVCHFRGHRGST